MKTVWIVLGVIVVALWFWLHLRKPKTVKIDQ